MFPAPPPIEAVFGSLSEEARVLLGDYFRAKFIAIAREPAEALHPMKADGMKQLLVSLHKELCDGPLQHRNPTH